ncbi:MAG: hypothetical protein V7459_02540 [Oceanicoccus sp.]
MSSEQFKQGLSELYQGEILGEALFDQMLTYFQSPDHQYKLSLLLQLETETKARLRPALALLGIDFKEQAEFRKAGLDIASSLKGKSWEETMVTLRDIVEPAVSHYKEIASCAPPEYLGITELMVAHEKSLYDFFQLELEGSGELSIDKIYQQIHYKFSPPWI